VERYGTLAGGTPVERYVLRGGAIGVGVLTYGGIIDRIDVPDAAGAWANVVLGYASLDVYARANKPYFGALIGRYANRIARGRFTLDGRTYALAVNDAPNSLHGGTRGFDKAVWTVDAAADTVVRLRHISPDGDEGYPGRLEAVVTYALDGSDGLHVTYEAVTDAPTIVNLTNHSYFNLGSRSTLRATRPWMRRSSRPANGRPSRERRSTIGRRAPSASASATAIRRRLSGAATITTGCSTVAAGHSRMRPRRGIRTADEAWISGPPSPASSSTPEIT
jgi:galactose mutarotase-like enzyme